MTDALERGIMRGNRNESGSQTQKAGHRSRTVPPPALCRLNSQALKPPWLAFDGLELRRVDRDPAGLLLFRHDALQIDMEQAVLEPGALDLDMLGKLEAGARRRGRRCPDADRTACRSRLAFALAGDGEDAVLDLDGEVLFGKAGDGDGDAVMILVAALDIVGRIALGGVGAVSSRSSSRSKPTVERKKGE